MATTVRTSTLELPFTGRSPENEHVWIEERDLPIPRNTNPSRPNDLYCLLAEVKIDKDEPIPLPGNGTTKEDSKPDSSSQSSPKFSRAETSTTYAESQVFLNDGQISSSLCSNPSSAEIGPVSSSAFDDSPQKTEPAVKQAQPNPLETPQSTTPVVSKSETVSSGLSSRPSLNNATPDTSLIDRKYYVSIDMAIPIDLIRVWEGGLQSRLADALCRSSRATNDSEAPLALEFYMVGTKTKPFKPTIVITCCSSSRKRSVKSFLGGLKWLKDSGLRHIIIVDKTFGHRASNSLPNVRPLADFQINVRIPPIPKTLVGVQAEYMAADMNGMSDEPIKFTIGGVILIRGRAYCMTVAHPFAVHAQSFSNSNIPANDMESDSESSDSDSSVGSDMSPDAAKDHIDQLSNSKITSTDGYSAAIKPNKPDGNEEDPEYRLKSLPYKGIASRDNWSITSPTPPTPSPEAAKLDWALLLIEHDLCEPNFLQIPGNAEAIIIDGHISNQELCSGPVWVLAGSGPQPGILNATIASVYLWGSFYDVRQVTLPKSLAKGDSGSWVVRDGRLCGYIIAGRDSLPWGYLVPIEAVFEDMKQAFEASHISFPVESLTHFPALSNTVAAATVIPALTPLEIPLTPLSGNISNASTKHVIDLEFDSNTDHFRSGSPREIGESTRADNQQQLSTPFVSTLRQPYGDDQQLVLTALTVLGAKRTGKKDDIDDLSRRIVGDRTWGLLTTQSMPTGNQNLNDIGVISLGSDPEAIIIKCLDLIDLDDSPHTAHLDLRTASGRTMLHFACSLGFKRAVVALLARGADPELQDHDGFAPLHLAVIGNHLQIVRRLMVSGTDPTIRTLLGLSLSDLATSEEVLRAARRIEHYSRTTSGTSPKSSATLFRWIWEPASTPSQADDDDDESSEDSENGNEYADKLWTRSRRSKPINPFAQASVEQSDPVFGLSNIGSGRQIIGSGQVLAPMVRRISSTVGNNRPDSSNEQDIMWREFLYRRIRAARPIYEEIYPQSDHGLKRLSAAQAVVDTAVDDICAEIFDQVGADAVASFSSAVQRRPVFLNTARIGQRYIIMKELQDQLRLAHAEEAKRLRRERNLFFWLPLILMVVLAIFPLILSSILALNDQARIIEVR